MGRLIIDGNKVYEIDEKCMERKKEKKITKRIRENGEETENTDRS